MVAYAPVDRSTLYANLQLVASNIVSTLSTLIIGPDYIVRSDNLMGTYSGSALNVAWPGLQPTEVVDQSSSQVSVYLTNAIIRYAPITVTAAGSVYGTSTNKIRYLQSPGIYTVWQGTGFSGTVPSPTPIEVVVGDYIKLTDGSITFETTVAGFQAVSAQYSILVLTDSFPAGFNTAAFDISLAQVVPNIAVPYANLTLSTTNVQINSSLTLSTPRTVSAYPVVVGHVTGLTTDQAYVTYRALRQNNVGTLRSITSTTDLATYCPSYASPASEAGFAIARALPPSISTIPVNVAKVLFIAVPTNDLAGYQSAVAIVLANSNYSQVVPLTQDTTIISWLNANLLTIRNAGVSQLNPTEMFISQSLTYYTQKINAAAGTIYVDVPTGNVVLNMTGGTFVTSGAQVNDEVRIITATPSTMQGTFTLKQIISNTIAYLTTTPTGTPLVPPGSAAPISNFQVWHPLSITEQVSDYGVRAATYANKNISMLFAPFAQWNGTTVNAYFAAAAVGGARGYSAPHQPLQNMLLEAGWTLQPASQPFDAYAYTLSTYGTIPLTNGQALTSALVGFANTTDQSSIKSGREQVTAAANAAVRYIYNYLAGMIGLYATDANAIAEANSRVSSAISYLRSNSVIVPMGSMVVSGQVVSVVVSPLSSDTLLITVSLVIPVGVERVQITVQIVI